MAHLKIRDAAELIGIASIVASLIFVGLQLKQAQEFAVAGQYLEQASLLVEATNGRMQNEALMRDIGQRLLAEPAFSEEQATDPDVLAARVHAANNSLTILDNDHFQYSSGFQSEEAWQSNRKILKSVLSTKYGRFAYEQGKESERTSFRALCEELIKELDSVSVQNPRWWPLAASGR
jgi:hypothetical protein